MKMLGIALCLLFASPILADGLLVCGNQVCVWNPTFPTSGLIGPYYQVQTNTGFQYVVDGKLSLVPWNLNPNLYPELRWDQKFQTWDQDFDKGWNR